MSFNVTPYLKDIDAEIAHHRATIAALKLKIADLEDMRVLMMQREEYRSAVNGHPSPFGELHGAEIAVRNAPALTAPKREPGLNKNGDKRGMHGNHGKSIAAALKARSKRGATLTGELAADRVRQRVLTAVKTGPLGTSAIVQALGYGHMSHKSSERRAVGNAVIKLHMRGLLKRNDDWEYSLP